jgi:hypothetical protein
MACDCCKTSVERLQCKSPIYVLSEVVDDSNIIFLLISKKGRTSCGGPLAIDPARIDGEPRDVADEHGAAEDERAASGQRAEAIIANCRRPTYWAAANDDSPSLMGESSFRRNQRLLEETSGFWPKRIRIGEADVASREIE